MKYFKGYLSRPEIQKAVKDSIQETKMVGKSFGDVVIFGDALCEAMRRLSNFW